MKYFWLKILLLILPALGWGAEDLSSWRNLTSGQLLVETTGLAPGHKGHIGFYVKLKPGWHTYWVNPGDSGEALKIKVETKPELDSINVQFPAPRRFETQSLVSFAYENEVLFPIEVEVPESIKAGGEIQFKIHAEWLVCKEVCIPAIEEFSLTVPVQAIGDIKPSENFRLFQKVQTALPAPSEDKIETTEANSKVRLRFPQSTAAYEFIDFIPFRKAGFKNIRPVVLNESPLEIELVKAVVSKNPEIGSGLLVMKTPDSNVINSWSFGSSGWKMLDAPKATMKNIWWILLSAFLGGLILNLMPCVFPILSMKLLSLVKLAHSSKREVIKQNLAYVMGVLISFVGIAFLLLSLRSSGQLVGWGFQLQSPIFVALLIWLFVLLALQLLGFFELDFLDTNMGHKLTRLKGLWGSFFTGVLAVVVASPCTAPFMGVAIGFGLSQSSWLVLLVFLLLGLGLAFPYLLFVMFPGWVRWLPKPGLWMKRLKEFMAFPLILTALWLLWLEQQLAGGAAVSVVLGGSVILLFSVWLSKWWKKTSWIAASLGLILCAGWILQTAPAKMVKDHGPWIPFSRDVVERFKGQVVFIDMTADWCLSCKVNEAVVLETPEIQEFFKENNIVLVKGDWTQYNPEITRFLNRFERAGVPFYVVFSPKFPDGKVLPEVFTKEEFKRLIREAL